MTSPYTTTCHVLPYHATKIRRATRGVVFALARVVAGCVLLVCSILLYDMLFVSSLSYDGMSLSIPCKSVLCEYNRRNALLCYDMLRYVVTGLLCCIVLGYVMVGVGCIMLCHALIWSGIIC